MKFSGIKRRRVSAIRDFPVGFVPKNILSNTKNDHHLSDVEDEHEESSVLMIEEYPDYLDELLEQDSEVWSSLSSSYAPIEYADYLDLEEEEEESSVLMMEEYPDYLEELKQDSEVWSSVSSSSYAPIEYADYLNLEEEDDQCVDCIYVDDAEESVGSCPWVILDDDEDEASRIRVEFVEEEAEEGEVTSRG